MGITGDLSRQVGGALPIIRTPAACLSEGALVPVWALVLINGLLSLPGGPPKQLLRGISRGQAGAFYHQEVKVSLAW